ncbi:MAG: hypothetical protein QM690_16035 [Sphingobium sp.]
MRHSSARSGLMASARPVLQPWEYVRLRREAAGLSIEEAARPYWHRPEHRAEVEAIVRRQEEIGFHPTAGFGAHDMARAYPFSLDVYQQLCTLPADQHPRLCLHCGWDRWTGQADLRGDETRWSAHDPDSCTRCEQIAARGGKR